MADTSNIEPTIKAYLLEEFLPGEDPTLLTATTPLVSAGVLDSIATLKLVGFLENTFGVAFAAHEIDTEHLDTIDRIAALIRSKQQSAQI